MNRGHHSLRWVYAPDAHTVGQTVPLDATRARHLLTVLRLGHGQACVATNGAGGVFDATIQCPSGPKGPVSLALGGALPVAARRPALRFVVGLPKQSTMEAVVEKLTEIGCGEIVAACAARSVVRPKAEELGKYAARWQGIAAEALEQSQQAWLPEFHGPHEWKKLLAEAAAWPGARFVFASESRGEGDLAASGRELAAAARQGGGLTVMIGPEGGFEREERSQLAEAGFRELSLGPGILRVETAAVAAATLASLALSGAGKHN